MNKEVIKLTFNWFASAENGEEHSVREVYASYNNRQVTSIVEHLPEKEGDKLYYDIVYQNGKYYERIFNPNVVTYDTPQAYN